MPNYKAELVKGFWNYQKERFPEVEEYFDRPEMTEQRPPVFLKKTANNNVLMKPDISAGEKRELLDQIPVSERHRWFRSMTSSQALAQSVFGNLKIYDYLNVLNGLTDHLSDPILGDANATPGSLTLEHSVDYLGEPRRTNLDVFISGEYKVAIECKLAENGVGTCSRPRLVEKDSNFVTDYCDGTYTYQRERRERCTLTDIGTLYWKYIPYLFKWRNDIDLRPCPVNKNYQLIRNILAACVRARGKVLPDRGHAVLIYDEHNPAFQRGGKGYISFEETRSALQNPSLLRKCSWQSIIRRLKEIPDLQWLTQSLELKYGL